MVRVHGTYKNNDGTAWYYVNTGKGGDKEWMFVLQDQVVKYVDLSGYTKGTKSQYAAMGLAYPLHNAVVKDNNGVDKTIRFHDLASPYGWYDPFGKGRTIHQGFDIVSQGLYSDKNKENPNLQLYAVGDGVVQDRRIRVGYGNTISLLLDQKDPVTGNRLWVLYGHLSQVPPKSLEGKRVDRDKPLTGCYMGKSGGVTGPHLHLQFCNNGTYGPKDFAITINPTYFYPHINFTVPKDNSSARILLEDTGDKRYDWNDNVNYDAAAQRYALLNWDIDDKYKK